MLFHLSFWIKEKSVAPLANRNICDKTQNPLSQFSHRITDTIDKNSIITNYDFENPIYQAKDGGGEDCEVPGELSRLLQPEERAIQPDEESVETLNLGTEKDKKEVKICADLEHSVKKLLIHMLHDYVEVFA